MSFLSVLQGIAQGAEKGLDEAAKIGVAIEPALAAANPLAATIASGFSSIVLGTEAAVSAPKSGPMKKETATAAIMLGLQISFELQGKQIPPDVQTNLSNGIDGLITLVNSINSITTAVQAAK